ncbi:MAG: hypothetical protein RL368_691 [Pseudomonadota bacterium]|jgi:nickel transport protein
MKKYFFIGLLAVHYSALAHDAWIEVEAEKYIIYYGHEKPEKYAPEKIKEIQVIDASNKSLSHKISSEAGQAMQIIPEGKPALFTLSFDNGFWTKNQQGKWENKPKSQVKKSIESSHALKLGKSIVLWNELSNKPRGQRLEIVPLNTRAPNANQPFVFKVFYDGEPLSKAVITQNGKETQIVTDMQGKASLLLTKGKQRIGVEHRMPLITDSEADTLSLEANLWFIVE